jgi:hypothetical protein
MDLIRKDLAVRSRRTAIHRVSTWGVGTGRGGRRGRGRMAAPPRLIRVSDDSFEQSLASLISCQDGHVRWQENIEMGFPTQ